MKSISLFCEMDCTNSLVLLTIAGPFFFAILVQNYVLGGKNSPFQRNFQIFWAKSVPNFRNLLFPALSPFSLQVYDVYVEMPVTKLFLLCIPSLYLCICPSSLFPFLHWFYPFPYLHVSAIFTSFPIHYLYIGKCSRFSHLWQFTLECSHSSHLCSWSPHLVPLSSLLSVPMLRTKCSHSPHHAIVNWLNINNLHKNITI